MFERDIACAILGPFAEPVRDAALRMTKALRHRIIGTVEHRAHTLLDQLPKRLLNGGEVLVKVEMLRLNVQYQRMLRMKAADGAIAFVTFRYKEIPSTVPVGILAQDCNLRSHVVRRVEA